MAAVLNDREVFLRNTIPRILTTTTAIDCIGDINIDPGTFFIKSAQGVVTPQYRLLDTVTTNFTAPTYFWQYSSSKDHIVKTLNFTGQTLNLTLADFLEHADGGKIVTYTVTCSQSPYYSSTDSVEITYDTIDWDLEQNKLIITDVGNGIVPYIGIKRAEGGASSLKWLETTYNNNQIYIPYTDEA
ncbi:MAG TPA: hypothetical protein V6C58_20635 [Allocoleopsis sp.]